MVKIKFLVAALIIISILINCESILNSKNGNNKSNDKEYIITHGGRPSADWFIVKELQTNEKTGVPAIVCKNGNLYLPIHSHIPDFNDKVVNGVFIPDTNYHLALTDTIFRITEYVRDTSKVFFPLVD